VITGNLRWGWALLEFRESKARHQCKISCASPR